MKNIYPIITFALCLCNSIGYAQTNPRAEGGMVSGGIAYSKSEKGAKPTGTPYYDETYRTARLSSKMVTPIRYNAHTDRLEFMSGNETRMLIPQKDSVISTNDKRYTYVFTDYIYEDKIEEGYLIILGDYPKLRMFARQRVGLMAESDGSNSYQEYRPAAYQKRPTKYFVKIDDKPIVQLVPKKKALSKMFPGKDAEIADYFKKNKVNDDSDSDMTKLGQFLSTLL